MTTDRVTVALGQVLQALDGLTERETVMVIVELRTALARKKWGDEAGQKLDESHRRVTGGRVHPMAVVLAVGMSALGHDGNRCTRCWEVHGPGSPCLEPPTIPLDLPTRPTK